MLHIHNIVHRMHCVPACNFAIVPKSFVTFDVPTKRHFTNYANNVVFFFISNESHLFVTTVFTLILVLQQGIMILWINMICREVAFEYAYNNSRTVNCVYEYCVIVGIEMYDIPTVYYYYSELLKFDNYTVSASNKWSPCTLFLNFKVFRFCGVFSLNGSSSVKELQHRHIYKYLLN